jgi:hypothetical protein
MIGLIWAFTPTFGIRMPLVILTWFIVGWRPALGRADGLSRLSLRA